jgi:hypothetical protein
MFIVHEWARIDGSSCKCVDKVFLEVGLLSGYCKRKDGL